VRTDTAFVLTLLVLCYAVVSGLVKRWHIAPALIFMILGIVLGPFGLGVLDVHTDTGSFTTLAQLALTVILFDQPSPYSTSPRCWTWLRWYAGGTSRSGCW
jgi:NhaP-type Na+/H+ or K+/H+ antiporter